MQKKAGLTIALEAPLKLKDNVSIELNKIRHKRNKGPLSPVVTRISQGYEVYQYLDQLIQEGAIQKGFPLEDKEGIKGLALNASSDIFKPSIKFIYDTPEKCFNDLFDKARHCDPKKMETFDLTLFLLYRNLQEQMAIPNLLREKRRKQSSGHLYSLYGQKIS